MSHYLQAILLLEDVRAQPLVADFMGIPASLLSAQFAASYKGLVGGNRVAMAVVTVTPWGPGFNFSGGKV